MNKKASHRITTNTWTSNHTPSCLDHFFFKCNFCYKAISTRTNTMNLYFFCFMQSRYNFGESYFANYNRKHSISVIHLSNSFVKKKFAYLSVERVCAMTPDVNLQVLNSIRPLHIKKS